ncbi:hypothetical protein DFA_10882 [Cavenderia fasciculata]|uniref:Uncharacterized protein n=1 Tax=Cavenderia fasciculata TaxID=261658 RepID=F4QBN6_CACFS|nr:uncharacterized protein DFA_10882 [Cavenderia fasciculata]EGG14624.1 hypothetical protein DFA_10882 [Cavenderia fasciculata]|eukprot:XP_004351132.1 hypothetical protein DFA_10882 [Cavenderia fasciculata]
MNSLYTFYTPVFPLLVKPIILFQLRSLLLWLFHIVEVMMNKISRHKDHIHKEYGQESISDEKFKEFFMAEEHKKRAKATKNATEKELLALQEEERLVFKNQKDMIQDNNTFKFNRQTVEKIIKYFCHGSGSDRFYSAGCIKKNDLSEVGPQEWTIKSRYYCIWKVFPFLNDYFKDSNIWKVLENLKPKSVGKDWMPSLLEGVTNDVQPSKSND